MKLCKNYCVVYKDINNFTFCFPNALHSYYWGLKGNMN
jgi:hypothetical protein